MTRKLLIELNEKFPNSQLEKSELVMRLLTPQEIEMVAGGDTTHKQGLGSSFDQHGGNYSQGIDEPYVMY